MPGRKPARVKNVRQGVTTAGGEQQILRTHGVALQDYRYWVADRLHGRFVHGVALGTFFVAAFVFFAVLQKTGSTPDARGVVVAALVAVPLCVAFAWGVAARMRLPGRRAMTADFARWCSYDYIARLSKGDWEHITAFARAPIEEKRWAYDGMFARTAAQRQPSDTGVIGAACTWCALLALMAFVVTFNRNVDASLTTFSLPGLFFTLGIGFCGIAFFARTVRLRASSTTLNALAAGMLGLAMSFVAVVAALMMAGVW